MMIRDRSAKNRSGKIMYKSVPALKQWDQLEACLLGRALCRYLKGKRKETGLCGELFQTRMQILKRQSEEIRKQDLAREP